MIAYRAAFLTEYQNSAYAARYLQLVAAVRKAESAALPGSMELTEAVAKNLFKLMAYKDEYEVARLYADGAFAEKLRERFDGDFRLSFHLAPPLLARRDPRTGHLQKREYGAWMMPAFRLLARLKFLRGTAFDPFGYTSDRKAERRLIADYEAAITRYIAGLRADRIARARASRPASGNDSRLRPHQGGRDPQVHGRTVPRRSRHRKRLFRGRSGMTGKTNHANRRKPPGGADIARITAAPQARPWRAERY